MRSPLKVATVMPNVKPRGRHDGLVKPSTFLDVLAAGRQPIGHMLLEFHTRGIAKLLESAQLDFVVLDMEHGNLTIEGVADLVAWFKATPVTPFVRVPAHDAHFIGRALDTGALGVMIPGVSSGTEAERVVRAAKYPPLGSRGVLLAGSNTDFQAVNAAEFMHAANTRTTVLCQIESVEGVEHAEAIAGTPGVDVLFVGPGDLAAALGAPGDFTHPAFEAAMLTVAGAARKHGKAAGVFASTLEQAQRWTGMGFRVLAYATDFMVYQAALRAAVQELRSVDTSEEQVSGHVTGL